MSLLRWVPALVVVALLAGVGGCAGERPYRVKIVSDPPGAAVAVVRPAGMDRESRGAPGVKLMDFAGGAVYTVEARPVGALEESYRPTRFELRRGDVHFLPEWDGVRTFSIKLLEREYIDLAAYEIVYAPGAGVSALRVRRRAYESVVEPDGRAVEPVMALREGDGVRGVAVSPDGERIAYASFSVRPEPMSDRVAAGRGGAGTGAIEPRLVEVASSEIHARLVRGTGRQTLTSRYLDVDPAFSPDGGWIVYSGNRDRFSLQDLYRQGASERTAVSVVTQDLGGRSVFWPSEGPGGLVAFSLIGPGARSLADAELCTKGGPAGYLAVLHNGVQPAVSPEGKRVAYIKRGDLFVCDIDGGREVRLTSDADEITEAYRESLIEQGEKERFDRFERLWLFLAHSYPAWTPDGKWILYSTLKHRDPEGRPNEDIAAISADGGREVRITGNPSADRRAMVSADGRWLYFLSNRGKQWAVWRMGTGGLLPE